MPDDAPIVARATCPGKIILSGEHAVVYGCPALVMAVDRYAVTTVRAGEPSDDPVVRFQMPALEVVMTYDMGELMEHRRQLENRLARFRAGDLDFDAVMPKKPDLVPFAFAQLLEPGELNHDLDIELTIDIPLGSGMGSSAAVGLSVLIAACGVFEHPQVGSRLQALSMTCESLLHGHPSGVDSAVCRLGGCQRFEQGAVSALPLPNFPLWFVHTGIPETSTGAAVMHVRRHYEEDFIWPRFHAITKRIEECIRNGNPTHFQQAVRLNHRLLATIGVVPQRVQRFIHELEAAGASAKICGAGAVAGDAAGMVMVAGKAPPPDLLDTYGYELMELKGVPHGARLV